MGKPPTLAALLLVVMLLACTISVPTLGGITGSGNVVTVQEDVTDFDRVEISHAFEATIRQADSFSVVIRVDDNLREYVRVSKVGQTLEIGIDPNRTDSIRRGTLEAEITMPALASLEASAASQVSLTGFASDGELEMEASGASSISGDIQAGQVTMNVSGASTMSLTGSGGDLIMDVSGASSAELEDFACANVQATVSGASSAVVNASGTLDVAASGASHLSYLGSPTLRTVDTSGSSTVEEK